MSRGLKITESKLWRGGRVTNHLSRLKHFRGHGVHSPFVYSLVRGVFMKKGECSRSAPLLDSLLRVGVSNCTAIEIVNLATHCHFSAFSIDTLKDCELIVCTTLCSNEQVEILYNNATQSGTAIVILAPYTRRTLCEEILQQHKGTSIDRFNYLILLNNHLPKQHFKL